MIITVVVKQAGKRDVSVTMNPGCTVEAVLEVADRTAEGLNIKVNGADAGLGTELQADATVLIYPKITAGTIA